MRAQEGRHRAAADALVLAEEDEMRHGRRDAYGRVEEDDAVEPSEREERDVEVRGGLVEEALDRIEPGRVRDDALSGRPLDRGQRGQGMDEGAFGSSSMNWTVSSVDKLLDRPADASQIPRIVKMDAAKLAAET